MQFMQAARPFFKQGTATGMQDKRPGLPERGDDVCRSMHYKQGNINFINATGCLLAIFFDGEK